jgi:hypothetical protein
MYESRSTAVPTRTHTQTMQYLLLYYANNGFFSFLERVSILRYTYIACLVILLCLVIRILLYMCLLFHIALRTSSVTRSPQQLLIALV